MWRGIAAFLLVLACAACGGAAHVAATTTVHVQAPRKPPALRVGVVGPVAVRAPGAAAQHGTLAAVANDELVLADARVVDLATLANVAALHPTSHFALVGGSTTDERVANLVGLVLREDTAARVGGVVAAVAASAQGGSAPRVAWVGPEERRLARAFGRGVHDTAPEVGVLHQWSRAVPARCKEAALTAIDRGALLVVAHDGICARAAVSGAHDRNVPALQLGDFELPSVAAALVVRDALAGRYHGGEDIVFGAGTGAIGVRRLDPRIAPDVAARARAAAQDLPSGR
jgi:hypothetical protein